MTPLALPDDWTHQECLTVRCLVDSGTHSIMSLPDYVAGLIERGWLAPWRDGAFHFITFTPSGAAALGLTLDGDPARWMTRAQSRKLDEGTTKAPRAPGKIVTETDLNASRERAGKPRKVVGDDAENRRLDASNGWQKRSRGGLAKPIVLLLGAGVDWAGAVGWACPVCGPQKGPKKGEYCLRCDKHWQDPVRKPGARRRAG